MKSNILAVDDGYFEDDGRKMVTGFVWTRICGVL